MELEVSSLVTNGKVVLGHLGFSGVEAHLVTGEPPLVANDSGSMDGGAGEVEVHVTAHVNILALIGRLNFATLLAVDETNSFGQSQVRIWKPNSHLNQNRIWEPLPQIF